MHTCNIAPVFAVLDARVTFAIALAPTFLLVCLVLHVVCFAWLCRCSDLTNPGGFYPQPYYMASQEDLPPPYESWKQSVIDAFDRVDTTSSCDGCVYGTVDFGNQAMGDYIAREVAEAKSQFCYRQFFTGEYVFSSSKLHEWHLVSIYERRQVRFYTISNQYAILSTIFLGLLLVFVIVSTHPSFKSRAT